MNRETLSDEQLMRSVARGDRERYGLLIGRYDRRLLAFLLRMVGDLHRAEDMLQEIFLAVWMSRSRYSRGRPFRAWLYGIAMNVCRAEARRRRPVPAGEMTDDVCRRPPPDAQAQTAEERRIVAAAIRRLPEERRAVVILRIYEQLPYARIAEIVRRPEGSVRSVMFHSLAYLRRELAQRLEVE